MSETISWWLLEGLLHFLWQGLLVGIALAMALRFLRDASAENRYAVCCVGLLCMVACFPVTLALLARDGRLTSALEATTAGSAFASMADSMPVSSSFDEVARGFNSEGVTSIPGGGSEDGRPELITSEVDAGRGAVIAADLGDLGGEMNRAEHSPILVPGMWVNALAIGYLAGVALMLVRVVLLANGSKRLRRSATLIDDANLLAMLDDLCSRVKLSVRPRLASCHDVISPAVIGVLRPMILVPPSMLTGLSPSQCETLLLHELAHIRRHDVLFLSLQRVVESLLFFHPAVWYASRAMTIEREHCCDDWVLRCGIDRVRYADALVRMAEFAMGAQQPTPSAMLTSAVGNRNQLTQRVLRLLTPAKDRPQVRHNKFAVCGIFAVVFSFTVTSVAWIDGSIGQEPEPVLSEPVVSDQLGSNNEAGDSLVAKEPTGDQATSSKGRSEADRQALLARYRESQFQPGIRVTLEPVFGIVRGFHEKPVVGAKVFLCERATGIQSWGRNVPTKARKIAETETDSDGRYSFRDIPSHPLSLLRRNVLPLDVIVMADGFAVRWKRIDAYGRADIQLRESSRVTGSVVDATGKPLTGASVKALRILPLTEVANTDVAARSYPRFLGNCVDLGPAGFPVSTAVDANGNFELDQLPWNSGVVLQVSHDDFYREVVYTTANPKHSVWQSLANPSMPIKTGYIVPAPRGFATEADRGEDRPKRAEFGLQESVQVSPIKIVMEPAVRLRVVVVDDESGQPIADARLPQGPVFQYPASGLTNADGIYEYEGLTPGELKFQVEPPAESEFLAQWATVRLKSVVQNEAEIRLRRGAVVSGQVVDHVTGRGVAGVRVNRVTTNEEGRFRLVTEPGQTRLVLSGRVDGYQIGGRTETEVDSNTKSVNAKVGQPIRDIEFRLRNRDLLFYGRTLGPNGKPLSGVRITGQKNARYVGGGFSYTPIDQASDERGRYVLPGLFADGSLKRVVDVPIIFRDRAKSLAIRVNFAKPADNEKTIERDVRLLPAGIVTGRVLHSQTRKPLSEVGVSVTLWNGTSGVYDGGTKTDAEGRFELRSLVPCGEYSVSFRKQSFVAAGDGRSYSQRFVAESGKAHFVADFEMTPQAMLESLVDIEPLVAPSIDGMDGPQAMQVLLDRFELDDAEYRKRIDVAKTANERKQIVEKLEPNPVYATKFMQLAERFSDSDIELKSLIWVCGARVVAGSDSKSYRRQKAEAAKRLLEKYSDREEIVESLATIVYRSESPQATAKKLARDSKHRVVRGRASLLAASVYERNLDMALRMGRQASERDRENAIEYYQQVVDQYADLSDWRHGTIGKRAQLSLRELTKLWIGQPAPEIRGVDLEGKPLKLSDFRGKIVILAFTSQVDWWSLLARDMRAADYDVDKVVVLGVYSGKDREAALESARNNQIPWRTWFDGSDDKPDSITRQWNNTSWPNYYVIDKEGIIRRRNMDRSGIPAAIEELW